MSGARFPETGVAVLDHEILAEKAVALGRAGERAEVCLQKLRAHEARDEARRKLLKDAADAVYAYFIQRELCGFRRHDGVIREMRIPGEVIVRLGAV